jgi:MFS transporter, FHS family, Na+ dependent glucose transporter 1
MAPTHLKPTKTAQTTAYFIAFIALGITTASLGPTLLGLERQTGVDTRAISYLFTARSFGFMLGSFRGGTLYDRHRGHLVMAAMILVMAAMMALTPLATTIWTLFAIMVLLGAAEGLMDVGANTLLVWVHGSRVGPFMNGLHFFYGVGAFLCPLLIAYTLPLSNGLAVSYWLLAVLTLPGVAFLLRLPSPQNTLVAQGHPDGQPFDYKLVALIAILLCLYVGAEVSYGSWIYKYVVQLKVGDESIAAYLTSAFWGALTVGRLVGVPVAARLRPRVILSADLTGCFLSILVGILWSTSLTALSIATIGLGVSMASIYPTALTLAERRTKITGQVTGFLVVGGSSGGMLLPLLIGQLFERAGAQVMMLAVLADLMITAAVMVLLIRHSNKDLPLRAVSSTG